MKRQHGHMHLDDFVARAAQFQNELIITSHYSVRYNARQVTKEVERKLPGLLDGLLKVWI